MLQVRLLSSSRNALCCALLRCCRTSVGRKPTGEFSQQFDKDYMRIGLRKP